MEHVLKSYRYSPFDMLEYRITSLPECEITSIMSLPQEQATAVWNLLWLSRPDLDALPEHGSSPDWHKHYMPVPGTSRAITADAIADEAMLRKLQLHPTSFLAFFEREDHSVYDCYTALGGEAWVTTVTERAKASARRMALSLPEHLRSSFDSFKDEVPPTAG